VNQIGELQARSCTVAAGHDVVFCGVAGDAVMGVVAAGEAKLEGVHLTCIISISGSKWARLRA
jgi:hypothetical protein